MIITLEIDDRPVQVKLHYEEPDHDVGFVGGWSVESAWSGDIDAEDIELTREQEWEAEDRAERVALREAEDADFERAAAAHDAHY